MHSSDMSSEGELSPKSTDESIEKAETNEQPKAEAAPASAESAAPATASRVESAEVDIAKIESATAASAGSPNDVAPPVSIQPEPTKSSPKSAGGSLIPFVAPPRAEAPPPPPQPEPKSLWRIAVEKRLQIGAVAAGVAAIATVAAAAVSYKAAQEQTVVAQYSETQNLADSVNAMKAKLGAMETARRDEVAELRKTVAELKSSLAAARESNGAVAQVNARAERLEKEQAAKRDEIAALSKSVTELKTSLAANHDSGAALTQVNARADKLEKDQDARIEKLSEKLDHDAAARNAELAARIDKLEKKASAPVVATVAPQPTTPAAATVATPPTPPVLPKTPTQPPPAAAANVSKETTGSIATPQAPIRGWTVREVRGNSALVEGPYGYRQIGPGDALPGAGRVERIERRATGWVVITDHGVITGAAAGSGYYRLGGYGAYTGAYGPQDDEF
jgi:uncharacterized coiled-coil protein SlyX